MDTQTRQRYEARAKIVKALAHATRLFIVDELSQGERCVSELTERIGDVDMSTVSRHLATLVQADILQCEKRGNHLYYSLRTPCVRNFFTCVENVLARANAI